MQVNYNDVDKGSGFCWWAYWWMNLSAQLIAKRKASTSKTIGRYILTFWGVSQYNPSCGFPKNVFSKVHTTLFLCYF